MLVRQGFVYALRISGQRSAVLRRWAGCRRFVFNEALAHQRGELAAGRKLPSYSALCARLPDLKAQHPWLCDPPAQAPQQALRDLCQAWHAKYTLGLGAPRFKRKGEGDALRFPQRCKYEPDVGTVTLPKLGPIRLRHSRPALGKLKNVTLRQERGRWTVSLQTEREIEVGTPIATAAVGLDFGAVTLMMPSDESLQPIELPTRISRYERRMRRLQQAVSRKKRGSANRKKAVARLSACHGRIASIRNDFLHKATTKLVATHALIAIEDLAVKSMTASAAGSTEAPGTGVSAKAGLNRSILRNGWSMARRMLEYKAAWSGAELVTVPPAYTSQMCSACGHSAAQNRMTQARFECMACGHAENADRNAAKNILRRAHERFSVFPPEQEEHPSNSSASTAGYAETHACESTDLLSSRPRSAAQGGSGSASRSAEPPLAGTIPELSLSGSLHKRREAPDWSGCQSLSGLVRPNGVGAKTGTTL